MPSQLATWRMENELNSLAVLKRRRLDGTESEAVFEKRRCIDSSHHSDWSDDDDPDWNDPDYDDGWIESELDRQHWEAEELAREAHDVEVMIDWEQDLRQLGLLAKAGQSRSLTEHIIEDHAEFWCLCLAIPRVYISDSVDEWYDEDTPAARSAAARLHTGGYVITSIHRVYISDSVDEWYDEDTHAARSAAARLRIPRRNVFTIGDEELAREAHDLEFMLCWEQELQELGHKAWQSRRLTEHNIEDYAEFCRSCTPRMLAQDHARRAWEGAVHVGYGAGQYWEAQELAREAH